MIKKLICILSAILLASGLHIATAAPTTTILLRPQIPSLASNGNPCLTVGDSTSLGLVSTSTGGSCGGGIGTTTMNGMTNASNSFNFTASSTGNVLTIATSTSANSSTLQFVLGLASYLTNAVQTLMGLSTSSINFATSGPLISGITASGNTITFTTVPTSTILTGYSTSTGANPSASIGTSAVNGSANTFMRSDGAPAINQAAPFAFSALGNTTSTGNVSASTFVVSSSALVATTTNPANSLLTVATGTNIMTVLKSGNVGFGTSTPSNQVTIYGADSGVTKSFVITNSNNAEAMSMTNNGILNTGGAIVANGNITAGSASAFVINTHSALNSATNGDIKISNNAGNDMRVLQFGGTTSGFGGIKGVSSSQALQIIGADNAANINLLVTGFFSVGTSTTSTAIWAASASSTIRVGTGGINPGCIELYDAVNSSTINYVFSSSTALVVTATKPNFCQ